MSLQKEGTRLRVATGCMAIATLFMGSTLITPLYTLYQRNLGFSELVLTLIYGAYLVGNLAALLLLGRISDQVGRRLITLAALVVAGATTVIFIEARGTSWLFCARALSGFAIGLGSSSATAWLAEAYGSERADLATQAAVGSNMTGLAAGALLAGCLAQYAPAPLLTPFLAYLPLLVIAALLATGARETLKNPKRRLQEISLHPRIGVPRSIRAAFFGAAATAFAVFALAGFYFALIPTILRNDLHETNLAVGGSIVCEFGLAGLLTTLVTRRLKGRQAQIAGLILLLPSLVLLVLAQAEASMLLLLCGAFLSGAGAALGFRGSLQIVNEIAPAEQRAEVISSYLAIIYLSNSLPIVGVGALTGVTGSFIAVVVFAALIGLIVSVNLITTVVAPPPGQLQTD
jgi:MFS family permease